MIDTTLANLAWGSLAALASYKIYRRLGLSRVKHPSLTGHSRMAKAFTRLVPRYAYDEETWLGMDHAEASIVSQRRAGFEALVSDLAQRSPKTIEAAARAARYISDAQFNRHNRIPLQFRNADLLRLKTGNLWNESRGSRLIDLDGQAFVDVSGSYGVNLFGLDFYKETIEEAAREAGSLGPSLGGYHPSILPATEMLMQISGMDEVSFHMSGTEAVMQAVRLARYHTGKKKLVRFSGAYHGWWDDVQPGPGNPMPPSRHTLTLRECYAPTLAHLRTRNDVACVLVNPIQAMHPNRNAPTDALLIDGNRHVEFDKDAYTQWLGALRRVCTEKGIVLIMDEVFLGFRLALGGAQEYFQVQADLVTYGKTLGGGLPIGVLCGKAQYMQRFKPNQPADVCFARGTFNAHPHVIAAMHAFLKRVTTPECRQRYAEVDDLWNQRKESANQRCRELNLPMRFIGMPTVWSLVFDHPGRYHWLLQFYLRREGIYLSWVGTGRFIFNFGFSDTDFNEFISRFTSAALRFQADGWLSAPEGLTAKSIRRGVLREVLTYRFMRPARDPWDRSVRPSSDTAVPDGRA